MFSVISKNLYQNVIRSYHLKNGQNPYRICTIYKCLHSEPLLEVLTLLPILIDSTLNVNIPHHTPGTLLEGSDSFKNSIPVTLSLPDLNEIYRRECFSVAAPAGRNYYQRQNDFEVGDLVNYE